MGHDMLVTGVDFICAALTLAYIAKLVFQGALMQNAMMQNAMAISCSVSKVSLRGQQIARRMRL